MKSSAYIALMVYTRAERAQALQTYLPYIGQTPIYAFNPEHIDWKRKQVTGMKKTENGWRVRQFPLPAVVYNQYYGDKRRLFCRLEQRIGIGKCFNAMNRFDKLEVHRTLASTPIIRNLPETLPYSKDNLRAMLERHGDVFLKPCHGSRGKGIFRVQLLCQQDGSEFTIAEDVWAPFCKVNDMEALDRQLVQSMNQKPYIIQKEMNRIKLDDHLIDFRIMMQKGTDGKWALTAGLTRFVRRSYFISNVYRICDSLQNVFERLFEDPERRRRVYRKIDSLCIETANVLERKYGLLGELGIDIILDHDDRAWLVEVNAMPSKTIFDDLTGDRDKEMAYRSPMDYCKYLLAKKKVIPHKRKKSVISRKRKR
jgi:hypothetical protein